MPARYTVETRSLTKTFKGKPPGEQRSWTDALVEAGKHAFRPPEKKTVVDDISIAVEPGEFFGIIGSNGAGKTTFLKMLACLLYPDSGEGTVNGYDILRERNSVRRSVVIAKAGGWMSTLWQLTGRDNLLFRARMCGLSKAEAEERAEYVLDRLEIQDKANEHSWSWSAGEQQKFSLAMTFIARTPVVMLDEPTSHLDPHVSRLVREFIREDLNRQNGQTVIMSTHYLEEADLMCDRVAVFREGRMLACDTPSALKRTYAPDPILEMQVSNYAPEIGIEVREKLGIAELIERFEDITTGRARLRPKWAGSLDPNSLCRKLEAGGVKVISTQNVEPTLDDVYFRLAKERIR